MKKVILSVFTIVLFAACSKDDDNATPAGTNNGGSGQVNHGNVDPEAVGKWLHGTFAMADYWGYNGSYQGNPFSQSVAFSFTPDGNYEMFYTGQSNYYGCVTDAFSYFKGYVNFTDNYFIVHPQQGRFRGYYNCSSYQDFDRPAAPNELKTDTFYYEFETDVNNVKWMVVRFDPADQYPSYFKETTW